MLCVSFWLLMGSPLGESCLLETEYSGSSQNCFLQAQNSSSATSCTLRGLPLPK